MASQYRYSKAGFQRSLVTAIGLTLIVSFLVWLFSRLFGFRHADLITLFSGMIFFGFCSASTVWRYYRDEVVFAVRPDGLFDVRRRGGAIPWNDIKDVRLGRAENDFELGVFLWPDVSKDTSAEDDNITPDVTIDLAPLDAPVNEILENVLRYKPIAMEEN